MKRIRGGLLSSLLLIAAAFPGAASAQAPFVKLAEVVSTGSDATRVFFGHVVAKETVELAFQVGGQIAEFPVEEGAIVPAGALVAKLDTEPFELALNEARVRSDLAQSTLDRYRRLEGTTISQTTVEEAETDVELTGIVLQNAERDLDKATLYAPFDALIASRLVPNFSTIGGGTPVVRLHDMSDLRIEIDVPETLFQQADNKPHIEIFAVFPASDRKYPLELREFNAETAAVGQTYSITLGMTPPDDLTVLPGSSVKVTARMHSGESRIEVPASAIVTGNDGSTYVMVFAPAGAAEGTVTRTEVEIAATERGGIEVVSGLEPGQEIVAVGASLLTDGAAVRRFVGFGN